MSINVADRFTPEEMSDAELEACLALLRDQVREPTAVTEPEAAE